MNDKQTGAIHLTDNNFAQTIKDAGKPVLVDFSAQWCGPCQMAAPIIDKLADEYKDKVLIVKVDVDENRETARQYGVMSIPTVIILKADKEGFIRYYNIKKYVNSTGHSIVANRRNAGILLVEPKINAPFKGNVKVETIHEETILTISNSKDEKKYYLRI